MSLTDVKQKMRIIALGGTFEILHKGHRELLAKAFQVGDRIVIGLTSDDFVTRQAKKHNVSNYTKRHENLVTFLKNIRMSNRADIIPLNDHYGPTIADEQIDGIVTSRETMKTALEINKIRTQRKFRPLRIYVIGFTLAKDGLPISTSRILSGLIDEDGKIL
ncbi:phosphopantetheine adenylyltransferase [[Eubacterium] cellulosolvens]